MGRMAALAARIEECETLMRRAVETHGIVGRIFQLDIEQGVVWVLDHDGEVIDYLATPQ